MSPRGICTVPRCKGRLVEGTNAAGERIEYCVACERRIEQLRSMTSRALNGEVAPAPPVVAPPLITSRDPSTISDAELVDLVAKRFVMQREAPKLVKRSLNRIIEACEKKEFPFVRFGRAFFLPRLSLEKWSASIVTQARGRSLPKWIAKLPRSAKQALPLRELEKLTGVKEATLHGWFQSNRAHRQLKRGTTEYKGRAVFTYWWEEGPNA